MTSLQIAFDLMRSVPLEYQIAGFQGILLGLGFGLEILIIIDLLNKENSIIIKIIRRYKHVN